MRIPLLALVLVVLHASLAEAQPMGRVVVIPHAAGKAGEALSSQAAEEIENALIARRVRVVSMHEARDRFVVLSREPVSADDSDLDVLAREARSAIEHVAFGRSAAAQKSVQVVLSRAERALESLNRETTTARQVLDACLALVRSALARDNRRDALAEAMRCRRLVPDVSASEMMHPASVIGVLAEADDQLRRMRIGQLSVESAPETQCAVYINGRHLGTTPFELDRAAAGEYRVQVECSTARGRVHVVELGTEPTRLVVDTQLDTAIRSEPRLLLSYRDERSERAQIVTHGQLIAKTVAVDDAVMVGLSGTRVQMLRVSASQGRVIARGEADWSAGGRFDPTALDEAITALMEGRMAADEPAPMMAVVAVGVESAGTGASTSTGADTGTGADTSTSSTGASTSTEAGTSTGAGAGAQRTFRMRMGALALSVAGAGLLTAGFVYEGKRDEASADLAALDGSDPTFADKQAEFDRAKALRWLGVGGGVLLTAAVPLVRVDVSRGVPWWSYVIGAGGLGLWGYGIYEMVRSNDCTLAFEDGSCVARRNTDVKGALVVSAGTPLVAFPITHALEYAFGNRHTEVALSPTTSSLMLVVRGEIHAW